MEKEKDYLRAAADAVSEQAIDNPGFGIPVDPDVADFMGAFTEDAVTLADTLDDVLLEIDSTGGVIHEQE